MRKGIHYLILIVLLAALGGCGVAAWQWVALDGFSVPRDPVQADGVEYEPVRSQWTVPLFFGWMEREFSWEGDAALSAEAQAELMSGESLELTIPAGYVASVEVRAVEPGRGTTFSGGVDAFRQYIFEEAGDYAAQVSLTCPPREDGAYGVLEYEIPIVVEDPLPPPPEPTVWISATEVVQGDTIRLELHDVPEGVIPSVETLLPTTTLFLQEDGTWSMLIGVADSHDVGEYPLQVQMGEAQQTISIEVTAGEFGRQDLWIDTSDPVISEANSPQAYEQYRAAIRPFYETSDSAVYWTGTFLQPVEGRISSEYGLLRYTNGSTTPGRHAGIDIAAAEGTPIQCPAAGKVVFSDYLLNTGNTLVIEHGCGLKTYYFHLSERDVEAGDMVEAGQLLGKVGTTGYSTGAHLHFEVRIQDQNLDPFCFFEGTGGCFQDVYEVTDGDMG